MQEIINEMDGLFKQVVKYYPMKDLAETKKQWNSLVTELKNCNLQNVSQQRELLVAYDNFKLMTPQSFSCSEECIDAFLATNCG